jgi:hypothetical protein
MARPGVLVSAALVGALASCVGGVARAQSDVALGHAGQVTLGLPRFLPLVAVDASSVPAGASTDAPSGTSFSLGGNHPSGVDLYELPRFGVDWLATRHLTLGVDVTGTVTLGHGPAVGDSPYVTTFGATPHVGYLALLARPMSVWVRAGPAFYVFGERGVDGSPGTPVPWSFTWKQLDADVELYFIADAFPHVAVTCGVFAEVPLVGRFDESRAGAAAAVGGDASWLHFGLAGGLLTYL